MTQLAQDQLDDTTADVGALGFEGVDVTTKPTLISDATLQKGINVYIDDQGLVLRRPAIKYQALVATAGETHWPVRASALYDVPGKDSLIVLRGGKVYDFNTVTLGYSAIPGATYTDTTAYRPQMAQLVTTIFRPTGISTGGLTWHTWNAGVWTTGTVTTWKLVGDGGMPVFGAVAAHKFRVFASPAGTDELYSSDYLSATLNTNWDKTVNGLRVGTGEGDPIVALISYQETLLLVFKESSIWIVDTADAAPANWIVRKLTGEVGCTAPETVVQMGQDVVFMSRHGVVSIGALALSNSVSPATAISAPMRTALLEGRAVWAGRWREFYLLGWDGSGAQADGAADKIFAYNTETKRWVGEWSAAFPDAGLPGGGTAPSLGWVGCDLVRPNGLEQTVLTDGAGRVCVLDGALSTTTDSSGAGAEQNIPFEVVTKAWSFGQPLNWKNLHRMEVEFFRQDLNAIDITLVVDGAPPEPIEMNATTVSSGLVFPFMLPATFSNTEVRRIARHIRPLIRRRVREVAVRISGNGFGRLSLRGITVSAFIDSAPISA